MDVQSVSLFFFFNDTATTEIYTLSLHDALPISRGQHEMAVLDLRDRRHQLVVPRHHVGIDLHDPQIGYDRRSEEHTSELQSLAYLVCRLLLEKKKNKAQNFLYRYTDVVERHVGV